MDNHWRNSMKPLRFFAFDAKAAMPFALFIIHMRLWTLFLTLATMMVFWFLERKGLDFPSAIRAFRLWLFASRRPAVLFRRKKGMIDTGSS